MIYSALYYPGSLAHGDLIVRDNRYYPGKYSETFSVWWQYLRKNYPGEPVTLFADASSPIPIKPLLNTLTEAWTETSTDGREYIHDSESGFDWTESKVTVIWLNQHSGGYFRAMQRNLVEAIKLAYHQGEDLFWLDNDCFLNTDIYPLIQQVDAEVAAPGIQHHQMTMDSVCTYISAKRLHALDRIGVDFSSYLTRMLDEGPTETRMQSLQEGGLYKMFAYGRALELGAHIELSHLSCYTHFVAFLERNPLNTPEYQSLRYQLASLDLDRLKGVEMTFLDMDYPANATLKEAR